MCLLEKNYFSIFLPVLGNQVSSFPILFGQVVMTIVVAFILEAFLFRIEYRKEHPTDEKGEERQILL